MRLPASAFGAAGVCAARSHTTLGYAAAAVAFAIPPAALKAAPALPPPLASPSLGTQRPPLNRAATSAAAPPASATPPPPPPRPCLIATACGGVGGV